MKVDKIKSKQIPSISSKVARQYSSLVERANAMGLKLPSSGAFDQLLKRIKEEGIARHINLEGLSDSALFHQVEEALIESPIPRTEWPALEKILGADLLSRLVGISPSSLHRYRSGERRTPDKVAARLHYLALAIGDLSGIYNEFGVRRWFDRKRTQLDGRSPSELLSGDWDPDDQGPRRVKELAHALVALPAT